MLVWLRSPLVSMNSSFAAKFKNNAIKLTADLGHRAKIRTALRSYEKARNETAAQYQDWQAARTGASAIKWEAINHLDAYLIEFVNKLTARGTKVFWASNGQEACDYIAALAKEKGARSIIKSKSMTSEEIHLNEALGQAGYEVVESDGRISDLLKILLAYFTFSWKKELHVVAGDLSGTNDIAGSTRMVAWVDRGA